MGNFFSYHNYGISHRISQYFVLANRNNSSDQANPESSPRDQRSRRDRQARDSTINTKQHYGSILVRNEVDNYSENSVSTGGSNPRRRHRRSRRRKSETQSLPPIGKPGSTTTNSTTSTENASSINSRNVDRDSNRSVSLSRGKENRYSRVRNRSLRNSYSRYDENDDEEDIENEYYAQMKIGKADVVSKKRGLVAPPKRKPTTFSKRLPAVADYKPDEYKSKRGINSKLPPMSQRPNGRTFSTSDPSSISSNGSYGSQGVRKPRQLDPLESDISTFDSKKHRKRTQKLVDQRYR